MAKRKHSATLVASASINSNFLEWMTEVGISHDKCCISDSLRTGRGVVAAVHIKEDEVVLQVPDEAVMLVEASDISDDVENLFEAWDGKWEDQHVQCVQLAMLLMFEKLKGKQSRWAPYLDFFPASFPNLPINWQASSLLDWYYQNATGRAEHLTHTCSGRPKVAGTACSTESGYTSEINQCRLDSDRELLRGTSVLQREVCPPFENLPVHMDLLYEKVAPLFLKLPSLPATLEQQQLRELFQWSVAVVASYAFELGDNKLQALVPLWDALNHVTGCANVRLRHCEAKGCLEMVATAPIAKGCEIINDYGHLSNGELLRRYGFVEPVKMDGTELKHFAASIPPKDLEMADIVASTAHNAWQSPNPHDSAIIPLDIIVQTARRLHGQKGIGLLGCKLEFAKACGLIPTNQRYLVSSTGVLEGAAAELFRLMTMDGKSFRAFQAGVSASSNLDMPCAPLGEGQMRSNFNDSWAEMVALVLVQLRKALVHPATSVEELLKLNDGTVCSRRRAAATVSLGEWIALDCCLGRITGTAVNGRSLRQIYFEADPSQSPARVSGDEDVECFGAEWLLSLCKQWWQDNAQDALEALISYQGDF